MPPTETEPIVSPDVLAAPLLLVLEGDLQRDLRRGRARVRVEDAGEARRSDLDQPRRQLRGPGVGEAEHRRVSDLVELLAHGRVDRGVAMAVDVAPERRRPVQVASALGVEEVGALAPLDHQRLFLAPPLLLGEGVPDVVAVELGVVHRHRLAR